MEKKTGTTTVGIKLKDGVVLAADTQASLDHMVETLNIKKILPITDRIAITTAGSVGDLQALARMLEAEAKYYQFTWGKPMTAKAMANLLSNILNESKWFPYMVQIIIGGYVEEPTLASLDPLGGLIFDNYTTTGSGSPFAIAILEDGYKEDMNIEDARELAIRAVRTAGKRDVYTGERKIQVITITKEGMKEEFVEFKE
ncbi:MAG TPA: archaeal proteasome endopeptidase complex subunit beta [Thermococcus sp.]|uniref:archaeal proteasome endopeptidase complex subunit beta n=1 Tax=Thermococcus sp. TaxID=35749 RepID=UPI000BC9B6E4|nr:archaeal proteasome endopeptidase complex subunit beta [Thermococcus sp.]OYT33139.1 MAG: proteasome endopeptidase complex, archaeal, beta subunit [Archaeoglobales archaeon ex4484_92]RLF75138.1 MAG: proteasome endopeptidase complex, archaeal, beta subunit [Thermococci archaeon]MCD6142919.1 archaeal proteasome endopeptidase complex subunit beta [Thermococcus sp.]RLF80256.1 MAG: proteasome endopeptidase complex, archaeal, beta subunit [Thermococci archaeon]RLF85207.1 MAG: proteasome endopeptid